MRGVEARVVGRGVAAIASAAEAKAHRRRVPLRLAILRTCFARTVESECLERVPASRKIGRALRDVLPARPVEHFAAVDLEIDLVVEVAGKVPRSRLVRRNEELALVGVGVVGALAILPPGMHELHSGVEHRETRVPKVVRRQIPRVQVEEAEFDEVGCAVGDVRVCARRKFEAARETRGAAQVCHGRRHRPFAGGNALAVGIAHERARAGDGHVRLAGETGVERDRIAVGIHRERLFVRGGGAGAEENGRAVVSRPIVRSAQLASLEHVVRQVVLDVRVHGSRGAHVLQAARAHLEEAAFLAHELLVRERGLGVSRHVVEASARVEARHVHFAGQYREIAERRIVAHHRRHEQGERAASHNHLVLCRVGRSAPFADAHHVRDV